MLGLYSRRGRPQKSTPSTVGTSASAPTHSNSIAAQLVVTRRMSARRPLSTPTRTESNQLNQIEIQIQQRETRLVRIC